MSLSNIKLEIMSKKEKVNLTIKYQWTYLHDISSHQVVENETFLSAKNHKGEDIMLVLPTIELLQWINIGWLKEQSKKFIDESYINAKTWKK